MVVVIIQSNVRANVTEIWIKVPSLSIRTRSGMNYKAQRKVGRMVRTTNPFLIIIPGLSFIAIFLYLARCNPSGGQCAGNDHQSADIFSRDDSAIVHKKYKASLVVFILSAPPLLTRREELRNNWLQKQNKDVMIRFVLGTAKVSEKEFAELKKENDKFKDLLYLTNVEDAFKSLTRKVLEMMVWADSNVEFDYMLKVDDDSFVRLDVLQRELESKSKVKLYWGFFDGRAHVHRNGKYGEADWVLCDRYIPYALGGGYVISSDLVHFVARNAPYLKLHHAEDVSLGSWLAPVDVTREHDPRFDTEYKSRGCRNVYIISHKQSIESLRNKWQHLQSTGKMCESEQQLRQSYVYNWNKLPSECCERVQGVP
ncbi:beta-1,3-galactosyltransferase 6-like isoform X1 [Apostichopus japonicus]|uniref:beta-1,3-galactosyltransferase 6-like isoform X1 n=2 Tax=Stichopus japonicus TaxID=307972 RepID=UPI003AB63C12